MHWPSPKSMRKFKDKIRKETHRCDGRGLPEIISRPNVRMRGWFGYFKHSYRTTFPRLDQWIRMRLRSIPRKRHKGKGRGRGHDHIRWPNAYFRRLGLYMLVGAHAAACQSLRRNR